MNLNIYIFLILFCTQSCVQIPSKYYFERNEEGKIETLQINKELNKFYYKASSESEIYEGTGDIILLEGSDLQKMIFPLYAEFKNLSPFEKTSSSLIQIGDSNKIELHISQQIKDGPLVYPINVEVLSKIDKSVIQTFKGDTLILTKENEGNILQFGLYWSVKYTIKVPKPGIYKLSVNHQEKFSYETYEDTTEGCFLILSYPEKILKVCEEKNGIPITVDFSRTCNSPFELQKIKNRNDKALDF